MPDLDAFQLTAFTVYAALALAWATFAVATWSRGLLFLDPAMRRAVLSVAVAVTAHWLAMSAEVLVPRPVLATPPGWLLALFFVENATVIWIAAGVNHQSRLAVQSGGPPSRMWLIANYLPALPLVVLAAAFRSLLPGSLEQQLRWFATIFTVAFVTWFGLGALRLRHALRHGGWRPGLAAIGPRRRDIVVLAAGLVILVIASTIVVGFGAQWTSLVANGGVGLVLSLPMLGRLLGQVIQSGARVAGIASLIATTFMMARVVTDPLARSGLHRLAAFATVVFLTAVAWFGRSAVDVVVDAVLLRGARRTWWNGFHEKIRELPVEEGVHACCDRYVSDAVSRKGIDGAAIVLSDGFVTAAGNLSAETLRSVWPVALAQSWGDRTTRFVGIAEMPTSVVAALASAEITGIMQLVGKRHPWGHVFVSLPAVATSDPLDDIGTRNAAALLAAALDVAELVERTVAVERSLAQAEERTRNHEELERSRDELSRAYVALQTTQRQLVQSEKMASLGQLVAGVAHEINNPVSFILGNVPPLRKRLDAIVGSANRYDDPALHQAVARVVEMVDDIESGAERTAGIVHDLRTFSRLGDGAREACDVHVAIDVAVRLLKPKWDQRIRIDRAYGDIPAVSAVSGQLTQLFLNLLANACEAIVDSGHIRIGSTCDDGYVRVTVADDGVGIDGDVLGRIFDPFFTTKPQGKGTGIGLSICYGIVETYGGRIDVSSVPGSGTTFTVLLPSE